jgi:O-antigen biosynthesis protein
VSRLSIIIPVLNKLHKLEDTLVSILENRPRDCQIVVVLNEPYADPYQLREEVCLVQAPRNANLIESINIGLAISRAPVIHILSCGTEVAPGWTDAALTHFVNPEVAAVAPLVLQRLDRNKVVSAGVEYRAGGTAGRIGFGKSPTKALLSKKQIFGADILAAFYRRAAFDSVGGLNPGIGGHYCSADLAVALHFAGFRCIIDPKCKLYVDPEDVVGAGRLGGGRAAERLFWTWAHQMGWIRSLSGHAALAAKECLQSVLRPLNILRLAGRAWEALWFPSRRRYARTTNKPASAAHPIAPPHFAVKRNRQPANCPDK